MRMPGLLIVLVLIPALSTSAAPPAKFAAQLAAECDGLIRQAVQRPYGWGWMETGVDDEGRKKTPKTIACGPGQTAAAGLVLFYAGDLLTEPKYIQAAREVARGLAAGQLPSGKFPATPLFNPTNVTSHEPLTPLPDRASTRAGLALLLTLIDGHEKDADYDALRRAASRAANWLLRQQADTGAWPTLYPPAGPAAKQSRVARLDLPDFRDDTLAVLLIYETLGDAVHRRSAERSLEFLERVRNPDNLPAGGNLWGPAYTLIGAPVASAPDLPIVTDVLASRYALQTFLGVYMVLGSGPRYIACERAAKSLAGFPKAADDRYHRWYTSRGDPFRTDDKPKQDQGFGQPAPEDNRWVNDFGLTPVLQTIEAIGPAGREKFLERLRPRFARSAILAQTVAGLEDGNIAWDFPATGAEVPAYLPRHAGTFDRIAAGVPPELAGRVIRLWSIYLRARIEATTGA